MISRAGCESVALEPYCVNRSSPRLGDSSCSSTEAEPEIEVLTPERRQEVRNASETYVRLVFTRQGHPAEGVTQRVAKLWKDSWDNILQENDLAKELFQFLRRHPDLKSRFLESLELLHAPPSDPEPSASDSHGECSSSCD